VAWAQQTDRLRRIGVLLPGAGAKDLVAKQLAKLAARKAAKKLAKLASQAAVKPKPAPVPPTEMPEQLRTPVPSAQITIRHVCPS
jgi:hypothetical protein